MRPNSTPTGGPISELTVLIDSVTGKPERRPRTIKSIASGNNVIKRAYRRLIIMPTTMCGKPMPSSKPTNADVAMDNPARNEVSPVKTTTKNKHRTT